MSFPVKTLKRIIFLSKFYLLYHFSKKDIINKRSLNLLINKVFIKNLLLLFFLINIMTIFKKKYYDYF